MQLEFGAPVAPQALVHEIFSPMFIGFDDFFSHKKQTKKLNREHVFSLFEKARLCFSREQICTYTRSKYVQAKQKKCALFLFPAGTTVPITEANACLHER
jgi:hypothetical protein